MCTISFIPKMIEAGIDSFKIEGRMKKPEYAAGVTAIYRKYIDMYYEKGEDGFEVSKSDMENLSKLYIRSEIQDGYYFRHNGKEMITPGKPSYIGSDDTYLNKIRQEYIEKKEKLPITIYGSFFVGEKASLTAVYDAISVTVEGDLVDAAQNRPMSQEDVLKCVKMVEMMNIDNIGLIENMAYYICPHCGEKLNIFGEGNGEKFAEEMEITYLGDLPIEESVSDAPNKDATISVLDADDEVSKRFKEIVEDIKKEFLE